MIVSELLDDCYLLEDSNCREYFIKMFISKILPNNKEEFADMIMQSLTQSSPFAAQARISILSLYNEDDDIHYPIICCMLPIQNNEDDNDESLTVLRGLISTTNDIKVIKNKKIEMVFEYISQTYFEEEFLIYNKR